MSCTACEDLTSALGKKHCRRQRLTKASVHLTPIGTCAGSILAGARPDTHRSGG